MTFSAPQLPDEWLLDRECASCVLALSERLQVLTKFLATRQAKSAQRWLLTLHGLVPARIAPTHIHSVLFDGNKGPRNRLILIRLRCFFFPATSLVAGLWWLLLREVIMRFGPPRRNLIAQVWTNWMEQSRKWRKSGKFSLVFSPTSKLKVFLSPFWRGGRDYTHGKQTNQSLGGVYLAVIMR